MVVDRERTIRSLAASFSRLPPGKRRRAPVPLAGNSLSDTYVVAEAHDGSQSAEGVVIDGDRDESGQWDFDADFTIFTTDEELLVYHGYEQHLLGLVEDLHAWHGRLVPLRSEGLSAYPMFLKRRN
jgi:hypothetical protein